jgi:hypothetical protein
VKRPQRFLVPRCDLGKGGVHELAKFFVRGLIVRISEIAVPRRHAKRLAQSGLSFATPSLDGVLSARAAATVGLNGLASFWSRAGRARLHAPARRA